jgi:hypothetical protein
MPEVRRSWLRCALGSLGDGWGRYEMFKVCPNQLRCVLSENEVGSNVPEEAEVYLRWLRGG